MKNILLLFAFTALSFAVKAQVKVGADNSFKALINDYKTYSWTQDIDQIPQSQIFAGPSGVLIFNNESVRSRIKSAIEYELSAKGFKKSENNPDILVLFLVTEQPATLRTYNGYQIINGGLDTVRTADNVQNTSIDAGTLLINILDAKSGKVAWQGYASGILKPGMVNDETKVREAVSSIFKQFNFKAKQ